MIKKKTMIVSKIYILKNILKKVKIMILNKIVYNKKKGNKILEK